MKSYYKIYDFLEFFSSSIALSASIITIIIFFNNKEPYFVQFSFIIITALSFAFLSKVFKFRKIAILRLQKFSYVFHQLNHFLRDQFFYLQSLKSNNKLTMDLLEQNLLTTGQKIVELIYDVLKISIDKEVCVTIKYFPLDETVHPSNIEQLKILSVKTLCINTGYNDYRENSVIETIIDNTDYYDIIVNNKPHFSSHNLEEYSRKLKEITGKPFMKTDINWNDYFKSRIVVPVRIKNTYINIEDKTDFFDYLGFICVDSKSNSAFRENEITCYIDLLKGFGDALYKYLDRFLFYKVNLQE